MAIKIIRLEGPLAHAAMVCVAAVALALAWTFAKWNFANTIAARMDTSTPGADRVADWLIGAAPGDPQTHLTAALIHERTLDPDDLARSLYEYEAAAALSPYDYIRWLDLGKARSLSGDAEGSLAAYARAMELAPNYASVQWVYGNALIRADRIAEGLSLIARAAQANSEYANPAVTTAMQIYDGDVERTRATLGDSDGTNAALALMLASQRSFDEAFATWSRISAGGRIGKLRPVTVSLMDKMILASKFRLAAQITADLEPNDADKPVIGQVQNGGFESDMKLRNAPRFEWQIGEGDHPQIGLAEGQPHGGSHSLFLIFNTFKSAAWRDLSQMIAVEPGVEYELEIFFKSDLKTPASLRWEVADATTTQVITGTPFIPPAPDWTSLKARFTVPPDVDGIIIRLAREGCAGPACQMNGKLSFDDISLKRL